MTPADIFTLEARDKRSLKKLKDREGYGAASVKNLFASIDTRRVVEVNRLLYALGIRHVGRTNSRRLARRYGTFEAIRAKAVQAGTDPETRAELVAIEGMGGVAVDFLIDFFTEPRNAGVVDDLLQNVSAREMEAIVSTSPVAGKTVVFTGLAGADDARRGEGPGRTARGQSLRRGIEADGYSRRGPKGGVEAEEGRRTWNRNAERGRMARSDRCFIE